MAYQHTRHITTLLNANGTGFTVFLEGRKPIECPNLCDRETAWDIYKEAIDATSLIPDTIDLIDHECAELSEADRADLFTLAQFINYGFVEDALAHL